MVYQAVGSPGSRLTRVTWMLEELGQPYEIVKAKMHTETMLRYNPSGRMPALADGDLVITDSAAIVLDDYGFVSSEEQKRAFDDFARRKGTQVLALPTGQGIILKE